MTPHKTEIDELTSELYIEEVAQLHAQIMELRSKKAQLTRRNKGLHSTIGSMGFAIRTRDKRIANLEAAQDRITQRVVDATLRKVGRAEFLGLVE